MCSGIQGIDYDHCKKFRSINLSSGATWGIFRCMLSCKSTCICINSRNVNLLISFTPGSDRQNVTAVTTNLVRSAFKGHIRCNGGCEEITSTNIISEQTFLSRIRIFFVCFRITTSLLYR